MSKGCCIIWLSVTGARLAIITPFQWPKPELIFPLLRCCSPKINAVGKVILRFRIKASIEYRLPTFSARLRLLVSFFSFLSLCLFVFSYALLLSRFDSMWSRNLEPKANFWPKTPKSCRVHARSLRVKRGARSYLSGAELVTLAVSWGISFGF